MIREYANEYNPDFVSPPGDTLADLLGDRGMARAELCERLGLPGKMVDGIIEGKDAITPETAALLQGVFGVSATFWNNRQRYYDDSVARPGKAGRLLMG